MGRLACAASLPFFFACSLACLERIRNRPSVDQEFAERHRLAVIGGRGDRSPQITTFEFLIACQLFQESISLFLRFIGNLILVDPNGSEEFGELFEVVLGPLVKGVLVTLGALDSNTQEGVGESDCTVFRRLEIPSGPEQGQTVTLGKEMLVAWCAGFGHRLAVFQIGFVGLATFRRHDSFNDLVVRHVVIQTNPQPLVPKASCRISNRQHIVELFVAIAGPVAKSSCPPCGIRWRFNQVVDQSFSLVGRRIGEELSDLFGRWKDSSQVEGDPSNELGVRAETRRIEFPASEVSGQSADRSDESIRDQA